MQGLAGLGLDRAALQNIFTDVASVAAYGSILVGELPVMSRSEAEDVLAEFGFLGRVMSACQLTKPDRWRLIQQHIMHHISNRQFSKDVNVKTFLWTSPDPRSVLVLHAYDDWSILRANSMQYDF